MLQTLQSGKMLALHDRTRFRALDRDIELRGYISARVRDVIHARRAIRLRVRHIHTDVLRIIRIENVIRLRPIIGQFELGGRVDQMRADRTVHHRRDPLAVKEPVLVRTRRVRLLRVDHRSPRTIRIQFDPALVRIRLPRRELTLLSILTGVVPDDRALVLHRVDVRRRHRDVQMERIRVIQRHHQRLVLTHRRHRVRGLVPIDGELVADVLVIVGFVHHTHVRHRVVDAVRGDRVREAHRVPATARRTANDCVIDHLVRAHALLDLLDRRRRRHIHNTEALGGFTVGRVHRVFHMTLLGHLHVKPVRTGRPRRPTKISRRELGAARITLRCDPHALRHVLRTNKLVAVIMHDHVRVHLLRVPLGLGRVDHIRHLVRAAGLEIPRRVHVRRDRQIIVEHRRLGLVLVEHDHDHARLRLGRLLLHELRHTHRWIIIKRIIHHILLSAMSAWRWCNVTVPELLPCAGVGMAGPIVGLRGSHIDRAHAHDTAVRRALARMVRGEIRLAFRARRIQRLLRAGDARARDRHTSRVERGLHTRESIRRTERPAVRVTVLPEHRGLLVAAGARARSRSAVRKRRRRDRAQHGRGGQQGCGRSAPQPLLQNVPHMETFLPLSRHPSRQTPAVAHLATTRHHTTHPTGPRTTRTHGKGAAANTRPPRNATNRQTTV